MSYYLVSFIGDDKVFSCELSLESAIILRERAINKGIDCYVVDEMGIVI